MSPTPQPADTDPHRPANKTARAPRQSWRADGPEGSVFQTTSIAEQGRQYTHLVIVRPADTGQWTERAWCESHDEAETYIRRMTDAERAKVSPCIVPAGRTAALTTYTTTATVFGDRKSRYGTSTPFPTHALGIRTERGTEPVSWHVGRESAERELANWRRNFPGAARFESEIAAASTHIPKARR